MPVFPHRFAIQSASKIE